MWAREMWGREMNTSIKKEGRANRSREGFIFALPDFLPPKQNG
jgi:hypothetical protein